ncbi:MAG: transcriptional regulator [Desulfobacula sp. RIFOXYA12_FULL_46_16]|nr:MAG: transcriptional regulator [Desulfobacula sp. RIFOXYA12_FULL_46_16]OGR39328.1 MAG: transcriptional regulator [Desulfobacula sp. RIFOXYB2_FULL_45_6]
MPGIDNTNKTLLNNIQMNFPIDSRPFHIIAQKLDLTEAEVIRRIRQMKKDLLIRRIGGNFSPDKLGYYSTLCTARVPEEKIDLFTQIVNSYAGVTHNYQRDHDFNIWFTFIAPSVEIIQKSLKEISEATQVEPILNLPATKVFKISANFKV